MSANTTGMAMAAIILGLSVIAATTIASLTYYGIQMSDHSISATGSARQRVVSDKGVWRGGVSRIVDQAELLAGRKQMDVDTDKVIAFLKSRGFTDADINAEPLFINRDYSGGNNQPIRYTLTRNIKVTSGDLDRLTQTAKSTGELLDRNVLFTTYAIDYYYTGLSELRVSLLSDALSNAKARAQQIANSGGRMVGALKSARQGVVQVLAPLSTSVSDYGAYDTSTIEKDVMVTVRAEFRME